LKGSRYSDPDCATLEGLVIKSGLDIADGKGGQQRSVLYQFDTKSILKEKFTSQICAGEKRERESQSRVKDSFSIMIQNVK